METNCLEKKAGEWLHRAGRIIRQVVYGKLFHQYAGSERGLQVWMGERFRFEIGLKLCYIAVRRIP